MEPLDDNELNQLLRQWKTPATPEKIGQRVSPRTGSWWRWLIAGTIRVPVPVVIVMVAALVLMFYFRTSGAPRRQNGSQHGVSLADFQPVRQLEPRVIGRGDEAH